jgi:hypothetical protein
MSLEEGETSRPCNLSSQKQAHISAPAVWVAVFTPCLYKQKQCSQPDICVCMQSLLPVTFRARSLDLCCVRLTGVISRLVIPPTARPFKCQACPSPSGGPPTPLHGVHSVFFHQWALTTLPEDRFSTVPAGNAPRITPHCPKCARLASARSQSAVWQHTACFQLVMGLQRSLQSTSCSMCSKRLPVGVGGPQALYMYQMLFSLTLCCIAQRFERTVTRIPTPLSITLQNIFWRKSAAASVA